MGELGALFNPGMRHELEERQAKAARREEEGNARDGDLRIDLESGIAVINLPDADDEQPDAGDPGSAKQVSGAVSPSDVADGFGVNDPAATDQGAEPAPAPALRPRGKRGMSASHR